MGTKTAREIWEAVLGELQIQVSKPNYRTWFGKTIGLNHKGNQFVVGVPNTFVAEYLEKNQQSLIEKVLIGLTSPGVQVVFQVNGKPHPQGAYDNEPGIPVAAPVRTRLNPNYDFDTFIEGSGNRRSQGSRFLR